MKGFKIFLLYVILCALSILFIEYCLNVRFSVISYVAGFIVCLICEDFYDKK